MSKLLSSAHSTCNLDILPSIIFVCVHFPSRIRSLFITKATPSFDVDIPLLSICILGFLSCIFLVSSSFNLVSCNAMIAILFFLIVVVRSLYLFFPKWFFFPCIFRDAILIPFLLPTLICMFFLMFSSRLEYLHTLDSSLLPSSDGVISASVSVCLSLGVSLEVSSSWYISTSLTSTSLEFFFECSLR